MMASLGFVSGSVRASQLAECHRRTAVVGGRSFHGTALEVPLRLHTPCVLTVPVVKRGLSICAAAATAEPEAPVSPAQQRIRIKLKAYDTELIKSSCEQIVAAAKATGARVSGPVPLPTRRRIYCVLRSPHVNKDSREHFETRTHQRLIDIRDLTAQTVDELMQLDLPSGVDVEVKL